MTNKYDPDLVSTSTIKAILETLYEYSIGELQEDGKYSIQWISADNVNVVMNIDIEAKKIEEPKEDQGKTIVHLFKASDEIISYVLKHTAMKDKNLVRAQEHLIKAIDLLRDD